MGRGKGRERERRKGREMNQSEKGWKGKKEKGYEEVREMKEDEGQRKQKMREEGVHHSLLLLQGKKSTKKRDHRLSLHQREGCEEREVESWRCHNEERDEERSHWRRWICQVQGLRVRGRWGQGEGRREKGGEREG